MEYIGDVIYDYAGGLYINMTNRCPCRCDFCIRDMARSLGDADSLWLKREPSLDELREMFDRRKDGPYDEVVFCGYGEPTERLDVMLSLCDHIKNTTALRTRLNTNGLSDLINHRPTAKEMAGRLDAVSVSLNAPTSEKYMELCHPAFGPESFGNIIRFTEDIKQYIEDVTMSVVSSAISRDDIEKCRIIAEKLGVRFRIR